MVAGDREAVPNRDRMVGRAAPRMESTITLRQMKIDDSLPLTKIRMTTNLEATSVATASRFGLQFVFELGSYVVLRTIGRRFARVVVSACP